MRTPFYYYDVDLLNRNLTNLVEASSKYGIDVHYALKANYNERILNLIQSYGLGADCVSGNEVKRAASCGFSGNDIVFAGVGKSDTEILDALALDIFCFHVESIQELEVINELAGTVSKKARVAIRLNPNVEAETIAQITTGTADNKFGIHHNDIDEAIAGLQSMQNVEFIGLHFHIGSQITNMNVFANLSEKVNDYVNYFTDRSCKVNYVNLGGGLGINYYDPSEMPNFEAYFKVFSENLSLHKDIKLHVELGRSVVAQCGDLYTKVLYMKKATHKEFAIVDAGMNDFMRPALYNSYHKIEKLHGSSDLRPYDVVGPICESTDTFAKDIGLPELKRGDVLIIKTVGAYGEVLSNRYNLRDDIKAYYSDEDQIEA